LLLAATAAQAAPYIPSSGQQVIETLPRRGDPVQQALRHMRSELSSNPNDLALATEIARRYIATGPQ
jgi:hypothetical protein